MMVSALVTWVRRFLKARHWLRSTWLCGQQYSSVCSSHWKSLLDNDSSVRCVFRSSRSSCGRTHRPQRSCAWRTRRLAELSSLQIVHDIRYPIRPAVKGVRDVYMCQSAGNDHYARFRLKFCRDRLVRFYRDVKILYVVTV